MRNITTISKKLGQTKTEAITTAKYRKKCRSIVNVAKEVLKANAVLGRSSKLKPDFKKSNSDKHGR